MDDDKAINNFLYDKLIGKYINGIRILGHEFIPIDDFIGPDAAYLKISIPRKMLIEFSKLNGLMGFPDPKEFWDKTGLAGKLNENHESFEIGMDGR